MSTRNLRPTEHSPLLSVNNAPVSYRALPINGNLAGRAVTTSLSDDLKKTMDKVRNRSIGSVVLATLAAGAGATLFFMDMPMEMIALPAITGVVGIALGINACMNRPTALDKAVGQGLVYFVTETWDYHLVADMPYLWSRISDEEMRETLIVYFPELNDMSREGQNKKPGMTLLHTHYEVKAAANKNLSVSLIKWYSDKDDIKWQEIHSFNIFAARSARADRVVGEFRMLQNFAHVQKRLFAKLGLSTDEQEDV